MLYYHSTLWSNLNYLLGVSFGFTPKRVRLMGRAKIESKNRISPLSQCPESVTGNIVSFTENG